MSIRSLLIAAVLVSPSCSEEAEDYLLSADDLAALQQIHFAYRDGWRANDSAAVMATLTDDAILIPHHGAPPVPGTDAIREFWWPGDSPPAIVTEFDTTIDEVGGSGDVGYLIGTFRLSFEYEGQTFTNAGNFLEISRKQEDGSWLISRRIWNDPAPDLR